MGASALEYARGRGMSQTTLTKFGIGYAPDSWSDLVDAMRKRATPIRSCGIPVL